MVSGRLVPTHKARFVGSRGRRGWWGARRTHVAETLRLGAGVAASSRGQANAVWGCCKEREKIIQCSVQISYIYKRILEFYRSIVGNKWNNGHISIISEVYVRIWTLVLKHLSSKYATPLLSISRPWAATGRSREQKWQCVRRSGAEEAFLMRQGAIWGPVEWPVLAFGLRGVRRGSALMDTPLRWLYWSKPNEMWKRSSMSALTPIVAVEWPRREFLSNPQL